MEPLADPLAGEVVAVPTRGVERWLTQRLSHRLGARTGAADGVCANIDFPLPATLLWAATAAVCGLGATAPADDPWAPEHAVWPLLQLVDEHMDDGFLSPLADHLRASCGRSATGQPRRFATVRHIADLYDRYGVFRPQMIMKWLEPARRGPRASAADEAWQAELWLALRRRLASPSPAERLAMAAERLGGPPAPRSALPRLRFRLDPPPRQPTAGPQSPVGPSRRPSFLAPPVRCALGQGGGHLSAPPGRPGPSRGHPRRSCRRTPCCGPGAATPARCSWSWPSEGVTGGELPRR